MSDNNIYHFDLNKRDHKETLHQNTDIKTKVYNLIDLNKKKYHFYRFPDENIGYIENFLRELSTTKFINILNNAPNDILLSSIIELNNNPQLGITLDELIDLIEEYPEKISDPERWLMQFLGQYNISHDINMHEHPTFHAYINEENYTSYKPDKMVIDMGISIYSCEIVVNGDVETFSDIYDFQKASIVTVLDFIIAAVNNMIASGGGSDGDIEIQVYDNQLHQTRITHLAYHILQKIVDSAYERYKWSSKNMTISYEEYLKSMILSKLLPEEDVADTD